MIYFRTPLQRRILNYYWKNGEPFTIDSLCEQGVVRHRAWGSFALKGMLKKHQIIRGIDERDGREKLIGTTDSRKEWKNLAEEKRQKYWTADIVEDFGLSGLNPYEKDAAIDEMIKMIEKKKREIAMRQKKSCQ